MRFRKFSDFALFLSGPNQLTSSLSVRISTSRSTDFLGKSTLRSVDSPERPLKCPMEHNSVDAYLTDFNSYQTDY